MDVILVAADAQRRRSIVLQDAPEVGEGLFPQAAVEDGTTPLGAEDDMDQNVREGLGHDVSITERSPFRG